MKCLRCQGPILTNFKWQQEPEFKEQPFCDRHCQEAYADEHGPQKPIPSYRKSNFNAEVKRYKG